MTEQEYRKLDDEYKIRLLEAAGGWKCRQGIPLSDEEVIRAARSARTWLQAELARYRVAVQVIRELDRESYYEQRCREEKL